MNKVILIGRLTKDVDERESSGGLSYANFTLAVDREISKKKQDEYENKGKQTCDFVPLVAFGNTAKIAKKYLSKGSKIAVFGSLNISNYKDEEGRYKTYTSVRVSSLEFIETRKNEDDKDMDLNYEAELALDDEYLEHFSEDELDRY